MVYAPAKSTRAARRPWARIGGMPLALLLCAALVGAAAGAAGAATPPSSAAAATQTRGLAAAQIDLDFAYDSHDPKVLDRRVDGLIARFRCERINAVFLQAFCDEDGDGETKGVYFATTHAPIKANVFNQAARRFKKAGFVVYAWMPTLSGQWLTKDDPGNLVRAFDPEELGWYNRATPFSRKTKLRLRALFADLARRNAIDGVLFQDDLYLNDFEDFSEAGKAAYLAKFHKPLAPSILKDQDDLDRWTDVKTATLNEITVDLMRAVRTYKPKARFYRNCYASIVLDPWSEEWFAQNFESYLRLYDGAVVMAYPYLEGARNPDAWVTSLVKKAKQRSLGRQGRVVFKFQTLDWKTEKKVSAASLKRWRAAAQRAGFVHYGLYPYP